ncbi:hypothetical protein ElyMa_000898900 [Elysia marginata]|uniref:Transmembrane protein n=1 Tax=Elysia marginata TaxID=1093978 RepID=A0AAV4HA68_9GAST|nr:hypothetical protein ElyMa_000898900 [Elysia marginata]
MIANATFSVAIIILILFVVLSIIIITTTSNTITTCIITFTITIYNSFRFKLSSFSKEISNLNENANRCEQKEQWLLAVAKGALYVVTIFAYATVLLWHRGGVVSASNSRSGGRGFDSRPCHVAIALGKQFTLTFPSPPTCKMGTQLQATNVLVFWSISGAALWRRSYAE